MSTPASGDSVAIGRILGAWGVQGWVQVYSWTDPPEALFDYQPWYLDGSTEPLDFEQWRRSGQRLVVKLPGTDTPEAAAGLADLAILVARRQLPHPAPGRYYWHDLLELEVFNLQGYRWGRVSGILPTGAHDVLKVATDDGNTVLIPFVVDHFIREVDLDRHRMLVDWPEDWVS